MSASLSLPFLLNNSPSKRTTPMAPWVITGSVLLIHLSFLIGGFFFSSSSPFSPPRSKIVVQTIQLNPSTAVLEPASEAIKTLEINSFSPPNNEAAAFSEIDASSKAVLISPASSSSLEKSVSAKPSVQKQELKSFQDLKPTSKKKVEETVKKPIPSTKTPVLKTKENLDKQKQLLQEKRKVQLAQAETNKKIQQQQKVAQARQSLAKIDELRKQTNSSSVSSLDSKELPQLIGHLEVDSLSASPSNLKVSSDLHKSTYQEQLVKQLESYLRLPEYGTLQLRLELSCAGQVVRLHIIKSENNKNQIYIEKTLPSLLFAPFGSEFEGAKTSIFTLTLRNKKK